MAYSVEEQYTRIMIECDFKDCLAYNEFSGKNENEALGAAKEAGWILRQVKMEDGASIHWCPTHQVPCPQCDGGKNPPGPKGCAVCKYCPKCRGRGTVPVKEPT